jgi:hypothetical protein
MDLKQGPIKELYEKTVQLEDIISNIDENLPETIENKIQELQKDKEESLSYYKKILFNLETRYNEMINELTTLKNSLIPQIESYKTQRETAREIITDLTYNSEKNRKYKDKETLAFLNESKDKITLENFNKYCNLVNCVINPPQQCLTESKFTFEIKQYNDLIKQKLPKNEMINSPLFRINFLSWNLHVYPWGSSSVKDKYLSIFIGLREGEDNVEYNYHYKFGLVNFKGKDTHFSEIGDKVFKKKGHYYGSERFFEINKIEKEGYINEKGSIIIECYIQPKNMIEFNKEVEYYYKISDGK